MKYLPSKIASEVIEKMSPYMERNNQDRVQLLLSQAQNISTLLGPSYSLTINGPDEANNESPVANVEREIPKKIEFENIWCNSEYENDLYLRMVNIWIEKALPVQRQNKRTLDIEYSWGKYKYTASERGVRNKYFTVYKKLTLTQDVRDGLKTVEEKARELDDWWNNIAREENYEVES